MPSVINSLSLENFQAHKHLTVEFSDYFNCITGQTNAGKSAIIRALDFILYGNWSKDYVHIGSDFSKIEVLLDNSTLTRKKGESVNSVVIGKDGISNTFENYGRAILPEQVSATGIDFLKFDDDTIKLNLHNQDDGYFIISFPAPLQSKVLSGLIGSHIINLAIDDIVSDRRESTGEIRYLENDIDKLNSDYTSLVEMAKMQEDYDKLKSLLTRARELKTGIDYLSSLSSSISIKNSALESSKINFTNLKNTLQDNKNKLDSFMSSLDVCPFCLQKIEG